MKAYVLTFLLLVAIAQVPVRTQMHGTVKSDRIELGDGEFVPRRARLLPESLVVADGQTVTLPADSTWGAIEVSGTLRVPAGATVRFIDFLIMPGGRAHIEGPATTLIVRDIPLDLATDPHQWGNGLVNFGRLEVTGASKTAWTSTATDLLAGATAVRVANADGWAVGDELLIPDTNELQRGERTYRRESALTIAGIAGTTLTLSKPLDFEHPSVKTPDGAIVQTPYVANLTRAGVLIRSENPDGTRGHTANVGHTASWDIQNARFEDLGRTRTEPQHDTTNHKGRYAAHAHHAVGLNSRFVGNVLVRGRKWSIVLHNTSDSLLAWNVGVDFPGGCFVTEDGNELRNTLDRNFCAYSVGSPDLNMNPAGHILANCPGCEGAGFWFRGVQNTITGNVSINNATGMNMMNQPAVAGIDRRTAKPVRMQGNVTIANRDSGLEIWFQTCFPNEGHLSAHNYFNIHVPVSTNPSNELCLKNATLVGQRGTTTAVGTSKVYVRRVEIDGGQIAGHYIGIDSGGGRSLVLKNLMMQNKMNIDLLTPPDGEAHIENVVHRPYQNGPHSYIVFGPEKAPTAQVLNATPAILFSFYPNPPMIGSRYKVLKHQGIEGEDYLLYQQSQLRTAPISAFGSPSDQCGTTQGDSWDRCGVALFGEPIAASDATTFDGLVNGVAGRPHTTVLGPPRAILTSPNRIVPAQPVLAHWGESVVQWLVLLTGDPAQTGPNVIVVLNEGKPFTLTAAQNSTGIDTVRGYAAPARPGPHVVTLWRTRPDGSRIDSSKMTFTYCVPGPCDGSPTQQ